MPVQLVISGESAEHILNEVRVFAGQLYAGQSTDAVTAKRGRRTATVDDAANANVIKLDPPVAPASDVATEAAAGTVIEGSASPATDAPAADPATPAAPTEAKPADEGDVDELIGDTSEPTPEATKAWTKDDVIAATTGLTGRKGMAVARDLYAKFGAKNVSTLKPEHYGDFIAAAAAA